MITAVDTNVLIDAVNGKDASVRALEESLLSGTLLICPIVYAELCVGSTGDRVNRFLQDAGISMRPFPEEALQEAARVWHEFLQEQDRGRERILPDFLIGTHANVLADRLLTRDRGFYRNHFSDLEIVQPIDLS